jgi:ATP-dependent helicase/nuclease subunit A
MTQAAYEHNGKPVSADQFYAIACDPKRSVAVEACAGAGKTWMLVSRIIRVLLEDDAPNGEIKAHEILAITFTKKAAGEMRQRLQEWLAEFAFATPEKLEFELKIRGIDLNKLSKNDLQPAYSLPEQLQNLYQKTLSQGRGVQIKTFHGWFASLLRTAPLSVLEGLNLPANYTLLEDDKLATPSVWRRFFGTLLIDEVAKRDFEELVAEHSKSQALKALDEALSKRVEFQLADEKGLVDASVPHFSAYFSEFAGCDSPEAAFANGVAQHTIFYDAAKVMAAYKAPSYRALGVDLEKAVTAGQLGDALKALMTDKGQGTPRKLGVLGDNEFVAKAQEIALRLQAALAQHAAWQHQQRMARLTRILIAEFAALKRQRGWVDMNDVERAALVMLSSSELSGWVQERLDARVKHLMIDEFQDTSPLQWQALYAWLSGYAGAGSKPPTVFIVGDPKQSIYRFRRAEPQVFIAAQAFVKEGLSGDLLSCDHTRRNAIQVMEAVNTVMLQAQDVKQYSDYRVHSTEIAEAGSVMRLPQIERNSLEKSKEKTDDSAEPTWRDSLTEPREEVEEKIVTLECRQAAQFIQQLLQSGKKPKEIMVLARKRSRLSLMQTELQALSIASQQPEKTNLADAPEVQDIIALLDVLVSPTHDLSLARALKSPIFELTDDDLVEIALEYKSAKNKLSGQDSAQHFSWPYSWLSLLQNSEQLRQQIRWLGAKLALWNGWLDSLPPHDALDAIFHDGDVLARYASAAPATQREGVLANLNALLSAALDIDQARYLTPYAFVRAMKAGLSAASSDGDSDMADATQTVKSPMKSDDSAIRLLTIHGAKGLEADVVIILDTDAAPTPAASMRVLVDWPGETSTPISFVFLASESRPAPSAAAAFDIEKQARLREELNALYVAMTRAREQLVISSSQPRNASAESWWQRMQTVCELDPSFPHPPSFPRRRESTSATMDSRLRGNDGSGADGHSRFNVDVSAHIELLVLPNLEYTKNTSNKIANSPLDGVFIAYDAIKNIVKLEQNSTNESAKSSLESLESRIGQAMHRLLQRFDVKAVDAVALEFSLSNQEAEQAAQMAQRIMVGEGAWAWDDAVISWQGNEIELTAQGKLLRLDRLVRRNDTGDWWVLDYKSESQPQSKPELVAQMRSYLDAVQACYAGESVRTAFLTAVGKMVEVI